MLHLTTHLKIKTTETECFRMFVNRPKFTNGYMHSCKSADGGQVNHSYLISHNWSIEGIPVPLICRINADDAGC